MRLDVFDIMFFVSYDETDEVSDRISMVANLTLSRSNSNKIHRIYKSNKTCDEHHVDESIRNNYKVL